MSNLDNLVAEILQQAQKEANRILAKTKAENLEFTEKENKKIQREVDIIEQKSKEEAISLKERILSNNSIVFLYAFCFSATSCCVWHGNRFPNR